MTSSSAPALNRQLLAAIVAFFMLFAGIGRLSNLVLHDPILAYADNYDMIRLQACHQIWPADKNIAIGAGTPDAPLRRYKLGRHIDTPCFASSELLFTGTAIAIATAKNRFTGEKLISIKSIGATKAAFLCGTALIAALYFYRRRAMVLLFSHSAAVLLIMADPGITLYLSTFYAEFSAAYFLYLLLLGLGVLACSGWQTGMPSLPLLLGLLGLGFSKPQHVPLVLFCGASIGIYLACHARKQLAILTLLCALLPALLLATGKFIPRNDTMSLGNKINLMGSVLGVAANKEQVLRQLDLPDQCLLLAGKNWYHADVQEKKACWELQHVSHLKIAMMLLENPQLLLKFASQNFSWLQYWLYDLYGQVEDQQKASVLRYQYSVGEYLKSLSAYYFAVFMLLPALLTVAALAGSVLKPRIFSTGTSAFLCFLLALPCIVYVIALLGDGYVDLSKHAHLALPCVLFFYTHTTCLLVGAALSRFLVTDAAHEYRLQPA